MSKYQNWEILRARSFTSDPRPVEAESLRLRQWRQFIDGLPPAGPMPEVILASWRRSREAGVPPVPPALEFRRVEDDELRRRISAVRELLAVAERHLDWLCTQMGSVPHGAYLVDRDGIVITSRGSRELIESGGLLPGIDWSEATMGTNGAGTALVADAAVAVVGPEHFSAAWHDCTCTAAPIHAPDGSVIGAIDVSTSLADSSPSRLALVSYAASVIDSELALHAALDERARLHRSEQQARRRLDVLARASRRFAEDGFDLDSLFDSITFQLGTALHSASALELLDPDGTHLHPRTLYHPVPAALEALRGLNANFPVAVGEGISGRVAGTGKSVLIPVIDPQDMVEKVTLEFRTFVERYPTYGLICVPLCARGRIIGTLTAWRTYEDHPYTTDDLLLLEELADRAAVAVDNARLYTEAEEASRAREEVLSVVSHDLRNPLGVISMSAASMLLPEADDNSSRRVRKSAEMIRRSATRMSRLIDDLMDFASIQAGRLSIERAPCSAGEIIAAAVEMFGPVAVERELQLESEVSPGCLPLNVDGDRVVQALANLLSNALKVTAARGKVSIGAEPREHAVTFFVRDTGPGISPDDLPRLFDRYWRSDRASYRGTGLGLAIAKGIVEAHGGRIWAESTVGAGSTFFVSLPAARSSEG